MKHGRLLFALVCLLGISACGGGKADLQEKEYSCLEDFRGEKIAILTGSLTDLELSKRGDMTLLRFANVPDMFAAVQTGQGDFVCADDASLFGIDLESRGLKNVFSSDFVCGDIGAAFRKTDSELCARFNEFLAGIKADGTYEEIRGRWVRPDDGTAKMPDLPQPEGEPIVVGLSTFFPFTFVKNGEFAGFEVEMMLRFGQFVGRPVKMILFDFGALIAALSSKKIDMIVAFMTITEERAKAVLFSDSYFYSETAFIGRDGSAAAASGSVGERIKASFRANLIEEDRWKMIADGLWETLVISFFAILFGTLFGALLCWMRLGRSKVLVGIEKVFLEIMRGIPLLVFLMIMFYVVFASSRITARWVAILAFALNFGAYVSEMFRTAIQGVDRGQTEAGLAMGFSRFGTFVNFVLPQAAKSVHPVYKGEVVSLIKNTSIVGYIAIQDLTKVSDIIRSRTFDAFFTLILISVIYFLLAWLIGKLLDFLGEKI